MNNFYKKKNTKIIYKKYIINKIIQYLVCPPFDAMTACNLRGSESTKLKENSSLFSLMSFQTSEIASHNSPSV